MRTVISGPIAGTIAGGVAERALRACVHCGFCNATCPTYQLTGDELDGPRGRIYLMKQALEGQPVSALSLKHLDRCLSCRACETTCPSGVQYHRLYDIGREAVRAAAPRPWPARLARQVIRRLTTSATLFGLALALGRLARPLLPKSLKAKVPPAVAPGAWPKASHARHMLLLKGCVQSAAAPHFNAATARVFDKAGIALSEAPRAGCCGAVDFHLDAPEAGRAAARRNIDAWTPAIEAGAQAVVVNSSGCAAFIRDYPDVLRDDPAYLERARAVAALVRDPIEVLANSDLAARRAPADPRIAVHEPCTLQHGLKLTGRIATLLARLGYEPQPVADSHLCCGSAGAYSLLQPTMSGKLKAAKLEALNASSPAAIYTANIGCWMHLADGGQAPVRHWIEAVDEVA
ncbi:glycolate oxidase subunit GlcF [Phenylobacterium sp.]|uniref:glycolate oxidase subunit GlcF n=1 Tax=Phenylobacterium sp. TaxID=1871053 RepID=UPI002734B63D|nr:glycolate oxidase subunit GlcF [Phenylobacterium sp.]MDP3852905.1 glycolate oxidase subunit GlcF [Phenylobacterium sp.]